MVLTTALEGMGGGGRSCGVGVLGDLTAGGNMHMTGDASILEALVAVAPSTIAGVYKYVGSYGLKPGLVSSASSN